MEECCQSKHGPVSPCRLGARVVMDECAAFMASTDSSNTTCKRLQGMLSRTAAAHIDLHAGLYITCLGKEEWLQVCWLPV